MKIELRETARGARYYVDDKPLARVTTILDCLGKPGLIYWAVNLACQTVQERLTPGQVLSEELLSEVVEAARKRHEEEKTQAGGYGTRAHQLIEDYIRSGNWPDLEFEAPPVANCLALWQLWWSENVLDVCDTECYVAHVELGYGGTVDCLATDADGRTVILDWKTSKAVRSNYYLQVAAYAGALGAMGHGIPERAYIIRTGREDAAFEVHTVWANLAEFAPLWKTWQSLCRVYRGNQDIDKRVRSATKAWTASAPVLDTNLEEVFAFR